VCTDMLSTTRPHKNTTVKLQRRRDGASLLCTRGPAAKRIPARIPASLLALVPLCSAAATAERRPGVKATCFESPAGPDA
jgi:hypothetical protein